MGIVDEYGNYMVEYCLRKCPTRLTRYAGDPSIAKPVEKWKDPFVKQDKIACLFSNHEIDKYSSVKNCAEAIGASPEDVAKWIRGEAKPTPPVAKVYVIK